MSLIKFNSVATMANAETLNPINRIVEEVKKTAVYEEKKITLKLQKEVLDSKIREKIDFEILIDASGSMRDSGSIYKTQEVIKDFINSLNPNYDRISITTFRGPGYYNYNNPENYPKYIKTIYEMNNNFTEAKEAIDNMEFGGFTPLLDGLSKAKSNLDSSGLDADRKVLIILGDGHPNIGPERDYYYSNIPGDYYGRYSDYYPGDVIKKQRNKLEEKWNNGEIDNDSYFSEDDVLSKQENLYPGASKRNFDNNQALKELKGTIYDNSKAEFYDLRYLIMDKVDEIKNAGYEIFSVFLNNEEPGISGYQKFLAATNEAEKLFREIAIDDDHYFYSENVGDLSKIFKDVKTTINTFDYFVTDNIEDGFELMPETFEASQNDVIPKVNGSNITWDISGVPYKELEVSYHIKREIPVCNLKVRYVDEGNGDDIIEPVISAEPLGKEYTTEKRVLTGYEYVNVSGNEKGTYSLEPTEIIYYYRKLSDSGNTDEVKVLSSIGGRIWNDLNKDGKQDDNEKGLKDVKVNLTDSEGNIVSINTDDSGNYIFNKLTLGEYTISIDKNTLPSNMEETFEKDNSKDNKVNVELEGEKAYNDIDFGYYSPSVIGETISIDKNKNNISVANNSLESVKKVEKTTKAKLPKTGSNRPYGQGVLGLLSLVLGVYIYKRK